MKILECYEGGLPTFAGTELHTHGPALLVF